MKKKIVVFTGAGISAESGLGTFRSKGGIWEKYRIQDVATKEAFKKNPQKVLDFYNIRRKQLLKKKPNIAHFSINKLKKKFDLRIITQNIDDLHERSGSNNVLHLHGKLMESKSTVDDSLIYPIKGPDLNIGEKCEKESQLRPNVVWFGEEVPCMRQAIETTKQADIFIIIGTSLNVFPAASLINYTKNTCKVYYIDSKPNYLGNKKIKIMQEKATIGTKMLVNKLMML